MLCSQHACNHLTWWLLCPPWPSAPASGIAASANCGQAGGAEVKQQHAGAQWCSNECNAGRSAKVCIVPDRLQCPRPACALQGLQCLPAACCSEIQPAPEVLVTEQQLLSWCQWHHPTAAECATCAALRLHSALASMPWLISRLERAVRVLWLHSGPAAMQPDTLYAENLNKAINKAIIMACKPLGHDGPEVE